MLGSRGTRCSQNPSFFVIGSCLVCFDLAPLTASIRSLLNIGLENRTILPLLDKLNLFSAITRTVLYSVYLNNSPVLLSHLDRVVCLLLAQNRTFNLQAGGLICLKLVLVKVTVITVLRAKLKQFQCEDVVLPPPAPPVQHHHLTQPVSHVGPAAPVPVPTLTSLVLQHLHYLSLLHCSNYRSISTTTSSLPALFCNILVLVLNLLLYW